MTSILYSNYNCPHSLKTSFFLSLKGIEFERVEVDLSAKQQRTSEYLAVNPNGTVPAYQHGDTVIGDSLKIMEFIDQNGDSRFIPTDPQQRAEALSWIDRANDDFYDVSHHLYWQLIQPPANGTNWDEVQRLKTKGIGLLTELENILSEQDYILGELSIADIVVVPWVYGYQRFDLPANNDDFPHVVAWRDKLTDQPAFMDNHRVKGVPFNEYQTQSG